VRVDIRPLRGEQTGAILPVDKRISAPRLADLDLGELTITGSVTKLESSFLATGNVTAAIRLQCSRCLVSYDESVTTVFSEEYRSKQVQKAVDLGPGIRTALLLALPNRPLHDPACKGLCVVCGKDLNHEPHQHARGSEDNPFAVLKKLK
jgi:uncharacterized protein